MNVGVQTQPEAGIVWLFAQFNSVHFPLLTFVTRTFGAQIEGTTDRRA